jgi:poly(3-hydroxybutyrate) depolymerase
MQRDPGGQFPYGALFWPAIATASAFETASSVGAFLFGLNVDEQHSCEEPSGATASKIALELPVVRLHDFSDVDRGVPTLLCTPLALHGAAIADLAQGHSLVAALRLGGIDRLFMTAWRSASPDMRFLGIDDYLANLNVLVDQLGGLVDLVGLCQGGWLSLVYAGRFPGKVRKLVMAGSPVDIAARQSKFSAMATATPLNIFQGLVDSGEGRVLGRNVAQLWGNDTGADNIRESLQTAEPVGSPQFMQLQAVFKTWNAWTMDVPGTYYLEVVEKLYKLNQLAAGSFVALGQQIELSRVRIPTYLLAGSADDVVAPEQVFAVARLTATPREHLRHEIAPCNHLGLFMGKQTLERCWRNIAGWMREPIA